MHGSFFLFCCRCNQTTVTQANRMRKMSKKKKVEPRSAPSDKHTQWLLGDACVCEDAQLCGKFTRRPHRRPQQFTRIQDFLRMTRHCLAGVGARSPTWRCGRHLWGLFLFVNDRDMHSVEHPRAWGARDEHMFHAQDRSIVVSLVCHENPPPASRDRTDFSKNGNQE